MAETIGEGQACWRLALRYNGKHRGERSGDYATLPAGRAQIAGETTSGVARERLS